MSIVRGLWQRWRRGYSDFDMRIARLIPSNSAGYARSFSAGVLRAYLVLSEEATMREINGAPERAIRL